MISGVSEVLHSENQKAENESLKCRGEEGYLQTKENQKRSVCSDELMNVEESDDQRGDPSA